MIRIDIRLLRLNKHLFNQSYGINGAPRIILDLQESGETCSKNRIERLIRENGMRTQRQESR